MIINKCILLLVLEIIYLVILVISNYKVESVNNEEVLFIYLDYKYEFGKIGSSDKKKIGIIDQVKDTLKHIKFNGKKIVLMVGTVAIATLLYTGIDLKDDNLPSNLDTFNLITLEEIKLVTDMVNSIEKENVENVAEKNDEVITIDEPIVIKEDIIKGSNTSQKDISSSTSLNQSKPTSEQKVDVPTTGQPSQIKSDSIVTVHRRNGTILNIELEEYLVGVVAAEMPASFNIEALKAQAVVARTYTLKRIKSGMVLTDTISTQEYKDIGQLKEMWKGDFERYYNKIKSAVDATAGKYIIYKGDYIDAVYHSTSNGYTEDSIYVWGNSVPYLKSVESNWDRNASSYLRTEIKDYNVVLKLLGISITDDTPIEVLNRNESGRITSIKIGELIYDGVNLRNILGLRSTDFDIKQENGNLIFTTRGYGHGVGMSQYGANGMANANYNYEQILKHYYQGVQII